ncbi:hydroxyethylthiazole kinase [Pseudoflavonifractor sp. DSM 107456]|uniref:Hydroxyethylthiazole kinase n=2 Tax=Pseudoflavonifractor TaxID=1017280 RepID=A0ABR9R7F4_9FIRM|nr:MULTISPECIES: hydroxyethylthiazole kinase [Pseudoflavonifractor]MBC5730018.1 hydroxyethylthiazole kinase [Pseudoflavonifractor hominis]MBE5054615.1 hydroxyethylthiazole kinase [Pseudoflavonifractor gallinarum]MBT9685800.1 hydroxyethylthiazole kinase [Pseudoflavonifractor sp. MCC625]
MERTELASCLGAVRERTPLVQCITNFVTVNDCANILLAAGGSPTMAHDIREVEEAVAGVQALVLNLGAIGDVEAMLLAGKRANQLGIPVVLDPVAAGVTSLRREACRRLLAELRFTVIRGNASEIRALALGAEGGSGVDVSAGDAVTEENLSRGVELCRRLAESTGAVTALSGQVDILSDGTQTVLIRGGVPTMSRVTGSGCMLTALLGAFCGANPERPLAAAAAAVAAMDLAGERAEARRLQNGTGNATFRTDLIDAVFNLTEDELREGVRYEIYQG